MSKLNKQSKRVHSSKVKFQVVLESMRNNQRQAEIARSYGINGNLITKWRHILFEQGHTLFEAEGRGCHTHEQKISELEQIIGKQTIEIALLKKFLGHYRSH